MRPETFNKYEKILHEVAKHDMLSIKDIRKIIIDNKASHAATRAMSRLGYITVTKRGMPCKINIKEVQPIQVRRLVEETNATRPPKKSKEDVKPKDKGDNDRKYNDDLLAFIEHRITAHIDHHVSLAHQSLIKSWFKKNQAAILSTAITVLVIAAIIAAFLLGKSL